ncbi:ANTAR domain-containing protein [Blastococcus haudaquaticus]|uniref:PAS domain S-box-containing protein n=1 Tax=Blastococcus haudaquaticus TaxID=1938745 RepID=A0A286GQB1_9ACTN|nr:ANTAR domain-containing protein [Blastococcus haudaquaticus]SOD97735.1 PAS domain S-box-containing protein [Blastococcus haudaquaticus]
MTALPEPAEPEEAAGPSELADLLRSLPGGRDVADRVMAELAAVQVAHEELRTAEEEMRAQQEQITQLLVQHDTERRWRGHMAALVPIGLCATDGTGALVDVNQAFATFLGTNLPRLRGKPLSVFLLPEDVAALRAALRTLGTGEVSETRLTVTFKPRHLPPAPAQLFGFTEIADHRSSTARVQWVLVPGDADPATAASVAPVGEASPALERNPAAEASIPAEEVIGLASALAELSALPTGEHDRHRLLGRMATLVGGAVPGGDWVSITVGSPLDPQRLGSDSAEAQDFDGRQVRAGEGPCWDAYRSGTVVLTDDVTSDPRWPALARLAQQGAVRSVISVPVSEEGTTTGAVNVYSGRTATFGPAGRRIAELAGAAVAGILQNVSEREAMQALAANLERALTSRAVIDQAKGMVMARLGVDADEAFARLVKLSSRLNVKLRDLAGLIVEGHVDELLRAGERGPGQ